MYFLLFEQENSLLREQVECTSLEGLKTQLDKALCNTLPLWSLEKCSEMFFQRGLLITWIFSKINSGWKEMSLWPQVWWCSPAVKLCHVPQMLPVCVCTSWKDPLYLDLLHKINEARHQKHQMIWDALGFEILLSPRFDTNSISSASVPGRYLVLKVAKKILYNAWRNLHSKYLQDHQVGSVLLPDICFSGPLRKKQKVEVVWKKVIKNLPPLFKPAFFFFLALFSSIALANRKPTF